MVVDLLSRGWGRAVAPLLLTALLLACGARPVEVRSEPPERAAPAGADAEDAEAAEVEAPAPADPGAGTPARRASEHLMAEGVEALEGGDAALAARRLEEAIRVDGSNGLAYHHLARARLAAGRTDDARGLLDRAIELLRPYPARRAEAERLRARLGDGER